MTVLLIAIIQFPRSETGEAGREAGREAGWVGGSRSGCHNRRRHRSQSTIDGIKGGAVNSRRLHYQREINHGVFLSIGSERRKKKPRGEESRAGRDNRSGSIEAVDKYNDR